MKKHALALAIAALPMAAFAQNATLYGTVATSVQNYNNGMSSFNRNLDGAMASNVFGVRGSEDLGGGLKANFQLEGALPIAGATGTNAVGLSFGREAWVGVSGAFGSLRFGTTDISTAEGVDSFVANGAGNFANTPSLWNTAIATAAASTTELGGDKSGVIRYTSPSINGFVLDAGYSHQNSSGATTDGGADIMTASVQFTSGPLKATVAMGKASATTTAAETDSTQFGVAYDFGMFQVGYKYGRGDNKTTTAANKQSDSVLNVAVPLGSGLTAHVIYATAKEAGSQTNKGSGTTALIGKDLSKRTKVFAAYTSAKSNAAGSFAMQGVTATADLGKTREATTLGIQHAF